MWSDSAATATPWPPAPGRVAAINSRPDSGCLPLSSTTRKAWPRSSASPHLLPRLLRIPAGLLPAQLRPWVTALRTSIEAERRPFPDIAPNTLGEIAEAVPAQEIIVFDYIDARGTSTQRRIEAHRHVHIDRRWYVFGWDLNREDWRVFRTDRVKNTRRAGRRYAPRTLLMGSALAYLRAGLGDR